MDIKHLYHQVKLEDHQGAYQELLDKAIELGYKEADLPENLTMLERLDYHIIPYLIKHTAKGAVK